MSYFEISDIEQAIRHERRRQDAKFGPQNHPDLDLRYTSVTRNEYAFSARRWQEINANRARSTTTYQCGGCPGGGDVLHTHTAWDGVLLEEVYEALAEDDPAKLRAELIQVASVAIAWIEAIDRRAPAPAPLLVRCTCSEHGPCPAHGGVTGDMRLVDGANGGC